MERVEEKESFRRFVVKKMLDVTCFGFFKKNCVLASNVACENSCWSGHWQQHSCSSSG